VAERSKGLVTAQGHRTRGPVILYLNRYCVIRPNEIKVFGTLDEKDILGTEIDPGLHSPPKLILEASYRSTGTPAGIAFQVLRDIRHLEVRLAVDRGLRAA